MGHETVSLARRLLAGSLSGFGTKRIVAGVAAAAAAGAIRSQTLESSWGKASASPASSTCRIPPCDSGRRPQPTLSGSTSSKPTSCSKVRTAFPPRWTSSTAKTSSGRPRRSDDTFVEQAFITKKFSDMFSMKVGRFLSYSGWETEEPTGLFQYSGVGYAPFFYGYYQQGISASYSGGMFSVMGSLVTDVFGYTGWIATAKATPTLGFELGVACHAR